MEGASIWPYGYAYDLQQVAMKTEEEARIQFAKDEKDDINTKSVLLDSFSYLHRSRDRIADATNTTKASLVQPHAKVGETEISIEYDQRTARDVSKTSISEWEAQTVALHA